MSRPDDLCAQGWADAAPTPGFEADALGVARSTFDEHGELPRLVLVEDPEGRHLFPLPVPHPSQTRVADALMRALSMALAKTGATGVAVVAEAWTVATTAEGRRAMPVDLADADGRREVLVAAVEHYGLEGGAPRTWHAPITRDAAGRGAVGAWRLQQGGVASGRMIGLLPPRGGRA